MTLSIDAAIAYAIEIEKSQTEIKKKAQELLLSWLTSEQHECFVKYGYFEVIGSHSKKVWYLDINGWHIKDNIHYCFAANNYGIPSLDNILLAKIMIETAESSVHEIAGSHAIPHMDGIKWRAQQELIFPTRP